jgi:hypothetical protein
MGRPSLKTPAIEDAICEAVSNGTTLIDACKAQGISRDAWDDWVNADEALRRRFARARAQGHDVIALDALNIADNTEEDPASRRVRVDTRLKLLSKWDKRYADKLAVGGDDDAGPVKHTHEIVRRVIDARSDA